MFQSTRPRGARLVGPSISGVEKTVSIHAPARGATPGGAGWRRAPAPVSIHAPARGATPAGSAARAPGDRFNPRAREGRDARLHRRARELERVSIHAPARGATPAIRRCPSPLPTWFQSTRPRGARPRLAEARADLRAVVSIHAPARGATIMPSVAPCPPGRFQSTRPRGARPSRLRSTASAGFNPRAREGRDTQPVRRTPLETWFQSTRPRGARPARDVECDDARPVSIHAPARGATMACSQSRCWQRCFNPRAREGRDNRPKPSPRASIRFQSTRPRGARHSLRQVADGRPVRFNPRAREGRDPTSSPRPACVHRFNPRAREGRDPTMGC